METLYEKTPSKLMLSFIITILCAMCIITSVLGRTQVARICTGDCYCPETPNCHWFILPCTSTACGNATLPVGICGDCQCFFN